MTEPRETPHDPTQPPPPYTRHPVDLVHAHQNAAAALRLLRLVTSRQIGAVAE